MRSLREPKALTIQPMRCRGDQNMAQILSKRRQQNRFQVVHFTSAPRFDEGQPENRDGSNVVSYRSLAELQENEEVRAYETVLQRYQQALSTKSQQQRRIVYKLK